ncbi:MAG: hypothetical protein ACYDBB_04825 [Armatimonadota bacterium]
MARLESDSQVQRDAESEILTMVPMVIGIPSVEQSHPFYFIDCRMEVDGYFEYNHHYTLIEVWAHVGKAKPAQRHKVMADLLKLVFLRDYLLHEKQAALVDLYYIFADEAASRVLSVGWLAKVAKHYSVKPIVLDLGDIWKDKIPAAQTVQDIRHGG